MCISFIITQIRNKLYITYLYLVAGYDPRLGRPWSLACWISACRLGTRCQAFGSRQCRFWLFRMDIWSRTIFEISTLYRIYIQYRSVQYIRYNRYNLDYFVGFLDDLEVWWCWFHLYHLQFLLTEPWNGNDMTIIQLFSHSWFRNLSYILLLQDSRTRCGPGSGWSRFHPNRLKGKWCSSKDWKFLGFKCVDRVSRNAESLLVVSTSRFRPELHWSRCPWLGRLDGWTVGEILGDIFVDWPVD